MDVLMSRLELLHKSEMKATISTQGRALTRKGRGPPNHMAEAKGHLTNKCQGVSVSDLHRGPFRFKKPSNSLSSSSSSPLLIRKGEEAVLLNSLFECAHIVVIVLFSIQLSASNLLQSIFLCLPFVESLSRCQKYGLQNPFKDLERDISAKAAHMLSLSKVRFLAKSFIVPGNHLGQQSHGFRWPYGPVALINPFNFPQEIHVLQLMGAHYMGNNPLLNVDSKEIHEGLDFSADDDGGYSLGIFSVKFSTDGRELVAGSSDDSIYVYDLKANKQSLRIQAHSSDVNTVCFADESGHLIYILGVMMLFVSFPLKKENACCTKKCSIPFMLGFGLVEKLASLHFAHYKVPNAGEMFTFGYVHTPPYIINRVISKDGFMHEPVLITVSDPIMMHEFAITENYAIFMDLLLIFKPKERTI
ncbi:hypothetical protein F8388_002912 [Cannabis sativa]|uniref:Uncharacterized protein n=1 Tax=Cannabis sativa TaxID=3483 RepID=A0A7J6H5Z3_CANSA|nr:hypothetical protein G4B88_007063 [Cannabis sativa]KAF4389970.1 hypothetical protein F8388_002912 [Cannabis sativa]